MQEQWHRWLDGTGSRYSVRIGDVLWYLSQLSSALGFPFSEAAKANIKKLEDRYARDMIKGSGDNR